MAGELDDPGSEHVAAVEYLKTLAAVLGLKLNEGGVVRPENPLPLLVQAVVARPLQDSGSLGSAGIVDFQALQAVFYRDAEDVAGPDGQLRMSAIDGSE
jgi:hypothetical protein